MIQVIQLFSRLLFFAYISFKIFRSCFETTLVRKYSTLTRLAPSRKHVSRANGGTSRAARYYVGEQCFDTRRFHIVVKISEVLL